MRKTVRKFVALTMVGVLAATPLTAFAGTGTTEEVSSPAGGSATGAGALEGYLSEDDEIFTVTLPTDDPDAPVFAFQMDPQNLLKATDSTNYATDDTVLFPTKTGTSTELSITNNSQFDVDVSLTAKMSGLSGEGYEIAMAADDTFVDEEGNALTDTSLYLGLVYETATANNVDAVASTTKALVADANGITEKVTLGGMPGNYTIGTDADGKYIYEQVVSPATATGVAKFKMVGACNPNADWSAIDDLETPAAPTVEVVWKVEKHTDDIAVTKTAADTSAIVVTTKDTVTSVQYEKLNGAANSITLPTTAYTVNGTTLTISSNVAKALTTGDTVMVLKFSDGTTQKLTISVQ